MIISLSDIQFDAIKKVKVWFNDIARKPVFRFEGLAGTGKSTVIPFIIEELGLLPDQVAFVSPTAMAAKNMGRRAAGQGLVIRPTTIHKSIYMPVISKPEQLEYELSKWQQLLSRSPSDHTLQAKVKITAENLDRAYDVHDLKFRLNPDSSIINVRLIVVDESSMVGMEVANDLKKFGIPILAMGDPGQLKPVDDVPGLCVGTPDVMLMDIHRQAKDNPIILYAHLVRMGEQMPHGDYGELKIVRPKDDEWSFAPDRTQQLICGKNRSRWDITSALRQLAGIYADTPQEGEPLIVCKNSTTNADLVNGTFLTSIDDHSDLIDGKTRLKLNVQDEENNVLRLDCFQGLFEEHLEKTKGYSSARDKKEIFKARKNAHHVDFGWVLTCHKAQGSQWPGVIVHDESRVFREDARNWIYTAATRAAEQLIVVRD